MLKWTGSWTQLAGQLPPSSKPGIDGKLLSEYGVRERFYTVAASLANLSTSHS